MDIEESFWKEKSRIEWPLEGDRNTTFFHHISNIHNAFKPILLLRNGYEILTDPEKIALHMVDYFKILFVAKISLMQNLSLVESSIPCLVNADMNTLLTLLPSPDEIKDDVFSLNNDIAPGPHSFGAYFYQTY